MTDQQYPEIQSSTADEWREFFSPFSDIVLVGNSEAAKPEQLRSMYPATTLFVFFNKVYKILDEGFDSPCLLISRSGAMGANIVHRREVGDVLKFFPTSGFRGIVNIRADAGEVFSSASAFGRVDVRHLDLAYLSGDRYPSGKIPTSGYALTSWLLDLDVPAKISLAGFSAKRSERWKVFDVHDWTFEQICLRVRARRGDIVMLNQSDVSRMTVLLKALPGVPAVEVVAEATEVLANRLDDSNQLIDRLMSVTKLQRRLDTIFRGFKPKTRKERQLSKESGR